jgi:hypothetical protein
MVKNTKKPNALAVRRKNNSEKVLNLTSLRVRPSGSTSSIQKLANEEPPTPAKPEDVSLTIS